MSDKKFEPHYKTGEYKGYPTFTIFMEEYDKKDGSKGVNAFGFGKKKAQFIVKFFDAIKTFAETEAPTSIPDKQETPSKDDKDLPF